MSMRSASPASATLASAHAFCSSDRVSPTTVTPRRAASIARLDDVPPATGVALLGPFDLFLQARDRSLLVDEPARAKALWPVLGRPGAVLADGDLAGTWRPRKAGSSLTVTVELWAPVPRDAVTGAAEQLAAFRGVALKAVQVSDRPPAQPPARGPRPRS